MKACTLVFFLTALVVLQPARSQTSARIDGVVLDAETGEALAGASVFLANTTTGAATDEEGRYAISTSPAGSYELVASMVGYVPQTFRLKEGTANISHDFRLRPALYQMEGVEVIAADGREWRRAFKRFEELLLGETPNAAKTEILNQYVLDFIEEDGELSARASEPLEIVNRSLGFRIKFVLEVFRLDERTETLEFAGKPLYTPLEPENEAQMAEWEENRLDAYRGSLQHFLWALIHSRLKDEGFRVYKDVRIDAPRSTVVASLSSIDRDDVIDATSFPDIFRLSFDHYLQVIYRAPSSGFTLAFWKRREPSRQASWLKMRTIAGSVTASGKPIPPSPLIVSGYMSSSRLADRLPEDYVLRLQAAVMGETSGLTPKSRPESGRGPAKSSSHSTQRIAKGDCSNVTAPDYEYGRVDLVSRRHLWRPSKSMSEITRSRDKLLKRHTNVRE